MQPTPQSAADELRKVSSGLNEIADKIESNQYDPKDWVKVSSIFSNVFSYIMTRSMELVDSQPKLTLPSTPIDNHDELRKMHQSAIAANKPIFANGGVFIPALGIILDINPLSESAEWDDAIQMAKDAGKRLPTIDELRYIYCYKDAINAIIEEHGGTPLASYHWSCTESSASYAWVVLFSSGSTGARGKYISFVVRAVAAF